MRNVWAAALARQPVLIRLRHRAPTRGSPGCRDERRREGHRPARAQRWYVAADGELPAVLRVARHRRGVDPHRHLERHLRPRLKCPANDRVRPNRMDINLDVRGLPMSDISIAEWQHNWVGYANRKSFHISPTTRQLEGLSVGTSSGVIRFKLYDKVQESIEKGTSRFWRSVWNVTEDDPINVVRFEWSIKVYQANFTDLKYLSDYSFTRFMDLLNYASHKWGRLCIPNPEDQNQSRWELAPLWAEIRRLIDEWTFDYDGYAKRQYDLRPDISAAYLKFITGSLGGFMARLGLEQGADTEASLNEALDFLKDEGLSIEEMAKKKWEVFSRLIGRRKHS